MTDTKLEALVEAARCRHCEEIYTCPCRRTAIEPSPEPSESAEEVAREMLDSMQVWRFVEELPDGSEYTGSKYKAADIQALLAFRAAGVREKRKRWEAELDRLMVEARKPVWRVAYSDDVGVYIYDSEIEGSDSACLANTQMDALIAGLQVFLSPTTGGSET